MLSPQENSTLIGHTAVIDEIQQLWQAKHLPHALMFSGTKGIGKATLIYHLVRMILQDANTIGEANHTDHPVFTKVAHNTHPDLLIIDLHQDDTSEKKTTKTSQEITVDDIRKINHFLRLSSSQSPYKVVIIDSIDQMNRNAANAILKLLEEPPQNSYFLLTSHTPGRILPTIRSRCRHVKMQPLSDEEMQYVLLSKDVHPLLKTLALGSPGMAITLDTLNGIALYEEILTLIQPSSSTSQQAITSLGQTLEKEPEKWELFLYFMHYILTNCMKYQAGNTPSATSQETQLYQHMENQHGIEKLNRIWEKLSPMLTDTKHLYLDKKAVVYTVFTAFQ